mgnify:CR=1 FL=1
MRSKDKEKEKENRRYGWKGKEKKKWSKQQVSEHRLFVMLVMTIAMFAMAVLLCFLMIHFTNKDDIVFRERFNQLNEILKRTTIVQQCTTAH